MNEDDTARRLRRISFDEMYEQVKDIMSHDPTKISPVYKLGTVVVERTRFYHPLVVRHYAFTQVLEAGHWTLEEFCVECEKRAIIEQVKEYNESLEFPQEIIDRAKEFFPNVRFTPARLELE